MWRNTSAGNSREESKGRFHYREKGAWVEVTLDICSEQKEPGKTGCKNRLRNAGLLQRLAELLPGAWRGE